MSANTTGTPLRTGEQVDPEAVLKTVESHTGTAGALMAVLEDIQDTYGYLPEEALRIVAERTGTSLVDVYGMATFYKTLRLKPRGKHLVSVCLGTTCHIRGAPSIFELFSDRLKIGAGETTPDEEFTLETVNCLGACALGPIVVVDGHYFSNVRPVQVEEIIAKTREGLDKIEAEKDERIFPLDVNCPRCNHSLMDATRPIDGLPSIRITISFENHHCGFSLSCRYGSFNIKSQIPIPLDTVMHFFCPHCYAELVGAANCTTCGAPMVPMVVRSGGMMQVCARRGCKEHRLELNGVNAQEREQLSDG